jgi:hypothetical protein
MSSTESRISLPSPVTISVPSPYHRWLIPGTGNLRLTRSGARHRPFPGRVRPFRPRRPGLADRPRPRISPATVFLLTRQPSPRSAAVIRGAPSFPFRAANRAATSASSFRRRAARGGSTPGTHL